MDEIQINHVVTINDPANPFTGLVGRVVSMYYQNNEVMAIVELNEKGHECVHVPMLHLTKGAHTVTFE